METPRGFAAILVVVVIAALALIFGIGTLTASHLWDTVPSKTPVPANPLVSPARLSATSTSFESATYGNFVFQYPRGWVAMEVTSGKGSQFQIYPEDAGVPRINIETLDPVRYDGGPQEVFLGRTDIKEGGNVSFPGLFETGIRYVPTDSNYPERREYAVFTPYGGLWIETDYDASSTRVTLADGTAVATPDLFAAMLDGIATSSTAVVRQVAAHRDYMGFGFSRDASDIYYFGDPIGADPKTTRIISTTTARVAIADKDAVYAFDNYGHSSAVTKLEGADPATFREIGTGDYALDKNHVYYWGLNGQDYGPYYYEVIPGADPVTFALVQGESGIDAKDSSRSYLHGTAGAGAP